MLNTTMTTPAAATLQIYENDKESTTRTSVSADFTFQYFGYDRMILNVILRNYLHVIVFHSIVK